MKKLISLLMFLLLAFGFACGEDPGEKTTYSTTHVYTHSYETIFIAENKEESEIILNKGKTLFKDYDSMMQFLNFELIDNRGFINKNTIDILFYKTPIVEHGYLIGKTNSEEKNILLCDTSVIKIKNYKISEINTPSRSGMREYSIDIYFTNTNGINYHIGWELKLE